MRHVCLATMPSDGQFGLIATPCEPQRPQTRYRCSSGTGVADGMRDTRSSSMTALCEQSLHQQNKPCVQWESKAGSIRLRMHPVVQG